jgi:hypothetical protein
VTEYAKASHQKEVGVSLSTNGNKFLSIAVETGPFDVQGVGLEMANNDHCSSVRMTVRIIA